MRIAATADPGLVHRPLDVLDDRADDRRLRVAAKEPAGKERRRLDSLVAQLPHPGRVLGPAVEQGSENLVDEGAHVLGEPANGLAVQVGDP
jgi:hypothetical protein